MILAIVEFHVSDWRSPGPSRWMVSRPDPSSYADYDDYDDGFKIRLHGRGDSHPRDTVNAAIQHALSRLEDQVPDDDRKALATVAEIMRPVLEKTAKAFETRFRKK